MATLSSRQIEPTLRQLSDKVDELEKAIDKIGTIVENSKSVGITATGIDVLTNIGPSIFLGKGTWVINGRWQFNSISSGSTRNIAVRIAEGNSKGEVVSLKSQERVYNAIHYWAALETSHIAKVETGKWFTLVGASTVTSTAQTCRIQAVRIA